MNRSFNLVLGISLCLAIVGGLWIMSNLNKEDGMWRPSDMYSQVGSNNSSASSFTNATLGSSSSNDGVQLSLRGRSFSSRAHAPHFSYAPVGANFGSQSSAVGSASYSAQGGGLYTTSSAEVRSFGGGGNVSAGTAGGFRANAQGSIAQAAGVSSSLSVGGASYTPVLSTSSSVSNDEMLAMAQASNVASASGYAGLGYTTATYGTASYGSSSRGISGRRYAPPGMSGGGWANDWLNWLGNWYYGDNDNSLPGSQNDENWWGLDIYDLQSLYDAWIKDYTARNPLDESSCPSFEEWMMWFLGNDGSHAYGDTGGFYFVPVGNYLPLLLLALAYAGYIAIRRRNKSLETTLK